MAKRKNKRRAVRRARPSFDWHEIVKLMMFAAIVCTLLWVARGVDDIPIKTIEVASELEKVSKDQIRNVAVNYYQQGFFTANLLNFENELNNIPWVYKSNVKREWPYKLVIEIEEQQPVFRWGDEYLLNRYAISFKDNNAGQYAHLPKLLGSSGREKYLARLYLKYNQRFNELDMSIASLEEDARYDKVITLENGIIINVGKENVDQQMERCLQTFPRLNEKDRASIASIDLRHSNGFAVKWNG